MTKEVKADADELASLMDDMEEMIALAAKSTPPAAPIEEPPVVAVAVAPTEMIASTAAAPTAAVAPIVATLVVDAAPAIKAIEDVRIGLAKTAPTGLQHFVDVNAFKKDTLVTELNMDQAMMDQAGLRAYYGALAAYAEGQAARTKAKFEIIEAKLYDEHRKILAASGEKVTEKMVESAVKTDPRWLQGKNVVIEAETIAQVNKGLTFSLADRRDMLIQLGADRREEMKGNLRVTAADAERATLAERALNAATKARTNS